ncbi:hypothetical protein N7454_005876 [Penicillium verhagenii]|nr:hypothetical protein N7454_005876 [Penicillium verhagenii]
MGMPLLHSILALCGLFLISGTTAAELHKREAACSSILATSGDTCATLAAKCGITTAELADYNTNSTPCSNPTAGKPICCSSGTLALPPPKGSDGLCYTYTLQADDTCTRIADGYEITVDEVKVYNNATYDWNGCDDLKQGSFVCLSDGSPPMPAALPHAICGPQVPGTARPSNMSTLDDLNPCLATGCKCNLTVGLCYNTVDSNSSCPTGTAAGTTVAAKTTSTKSTAASTKAKTTVLSTSTLTTSTKPTATSTKKTSTLSEKETIATSITSVVEITRLSWTKPTTTTSTTSKVEIITTSTTHTSSTSTLSKTTTHKDTTTTAKEESSSTSTSTASTSSYEPWQVAMYSEDDCQGDYYILSGSNEKWATTCIDLHGGLSSGFTESGTWCRWFTDGGNDSTDCDMGTLTTPASWYFTNAICSVYPSSNCTNTGGTAQAYSSAPSLAGTPNCTNFADDTFKVTPWGSFQCNTYDSTNI